MELRGIIHCHSTYSYDAKLSLSELKKLFVTHGLQFVCMTEHTDTLTKEKADAFVRECDALSDTTFRFIPGFEVPHKRAHILMIGARTFHGAYAGTTEALAPWTEAASFVVLAHPVRNAFKVADALLSLLDGIEVWNQQYEGKRVPRTRSLALFESLKEKKPSLVATGGVDFHRKEHLGSPYVTLQVHEFTEKAILEKLSVGAYTVSSDEALLYGSLPDPREAMRKYRNKSRISVLIIVCGKFVNKVLASLNLSFPSWIKELVRRSI